MKNETSGEVVSKEVVDLVGDHRRLLDSLRGLLDGSRCLATSLQIQVSCPWWDSRVSWKGFSVSWVDFVVLEGYSIRFSFGFGEGTCL